MNPLIDKAKPFVFLRFIHTDGKEHTFYSGENRLTGSRLTGFDSSPPCIDESLGQTRKTVETIREKAQRIISQEHSRHFA